MLFLVKVLKFYFDLLLIVPQTLIAFVHLIVCFLFIEVLHQNHEIEPN